MYEVHDVVAELSGNGYSTEEVLELTMKLTQYASMKESLTNELLNVFDAGEVEDIVQTLKSPSNQRQILANSLTMLTERQKRCYLMHAVESKSFAAIGKELGVSKGTVHTHILRARRKIEEVKDAVMLHA